MIFKYKIKLPKIMPFQICRVCYQRGHDLLNLKDEVHSYEQKLSSCIPEIDIYVIHNPGICRRCADMLDVAFKFRSLCLENEKRYNSTFVGGNSDPTILINCKNKSVAGENHIENVRYESDTKYDRPDLLSVLEVKTEHVIFCSVCNEEFSSDHDKELHDSSFHQKSQHKNSKSLLPICENSNSSLLTKQSNVDENPMPLTFIDCNTIFTDNDELKSHKPIHLKKSCHICKKTFDEENELNDHVKLHFIKCCGESFSTGRLLQLHTFSKHNMTCGICNEQFTRIKVLFNHVLDHVEDHWYKCNFCGKQFKTNKGLNKHNCQYYSCDLCGTIYFTKKTYNEHAKSHEGPTQSTKRAEIEGFLCERCNKYYQTESILLEHISNEHVAEENFQLNSNPFGFQKNTLPCCLCGKEYQLHIHLKTHILQAHCNKILTIPVADCRKPGVYIYRKREYFRKNLNILSKYLTQTREIKDLVGNKNLQRNFKKLSQYLTITEKVHISTDKLILRCTKICFICNIMYTTVKSICAHVKTSHSSCCNQKFNSVGGYFQHNFTHYDESEIVGGDNEILCLGCTSKHKSYTALLIHRCGDYKKNRCIMNKKENMCKGKVKVKCKNHVSLKNGWRDIGNSETEGNINTRCTIELHEIDPFDQSECVPFESDNSNRSTCEICREQFDCKSILLDHIKIHI